MIQQQRRKVFAIIGTIFNGTIIIILIAGAIAGQNP
jgi:hypothetical protein